MTSKNKSINDNSVKCVNNSDNTKNIEVYKSQIEYYADDYISNVLGINHEDIIGNSALFAGMMKHIYLNIFKPKPEERTRWGSASNLDLENIELLDQIWDVYTSFCYKYKKRPTILSYCVMTGISNTTVNTWINGTMRGGASSPHSQAAKKWRAETESAIFDGATENNSIGCIFALKACYGYAEAPQEIRVSSGPAAQESREEIAQKYADALELPEPEAPEL